MSAFCSQHFLAGVFGLELALAAGVLKENTNKQTEPVVSASSKIIDFLIGIMHSL